MKKNLFYLFALICSMSLFTACGSDDDDNNNDLTLEQVIDEQLVGTYAGTFDITSNGMSLGSDIAQDVILTKSSANALKLEVKNLAISEELVLDISLEPCTVVEANGLYTFEGSQTVSVGTLGTFPVTVGGAFTDGNVAMDITVLQVPMLNQVDVTFEGSKK